METEVPERPWWFVVTVGRDPRRTVMRVVVLVVTVLLAWKFAFLPIRVQGISMLPTYRNNQLNVVNRLAYVFHGPRRGDIVAVRIGETGESVMLLKRVVGLPGESISFRQGRLYVNGEELEEPYMKLPSRWNMNEVKVGLDQYYVVGDNRTMAIQDHTRGRPHRRDIVGKALL
jgi:signal peptidase I